MDNFDLKKYLVENKVTRNSRMLKEDKTSDYVSFAMQHIGDENTPVTLTHGFNRYDEKKYKTTLGKALSFIEKNAEKAAIENNDVTVDGGQGEVQITIGDQEFDIKKATDKLNEDMEKSIKAEIAAAAEIYKDDVDEKHAMMLGAEDIYDKYRQAGDEDKAELAKSIMRSYESKP